MHVHIPYTHIYIYIYIYRLLSRIMKEVKKNMPKNIIIITNIKAKIFIIKLPEFLKRRCINNNKNHHLFGFPIILLG